MRKQELNEILKLHQLWLEDNENGKRADLQEANLQGADLQEADLQEANLQGADLQEADLREAHLRKAHLQGADLQGADLRGADLREADLQVADLDFSCWPLWCGTKDVIVGIKEARYLLAHFCALKIVGKGSKAYKDLQKQCLPEACKFHHAKELGLKQAAAESGERSKR